MLQNVEYSNKPERFIYERANGMAHITLADNIHEGVNASNEDCWFCNLYMMVLPDSDNMVQRLERSYDKFLAKAKADEAETKRKEQNKPEPKLNIVQMTREDFNLLDATDFNTVYYVTETDGTMTMMKGDNR